MVEVSLNPDGEITYVFPEETLSTYGVATSGLRWSREGKLQQQWQICKISNLFLKAPDETFEWRDVPQDGEVKQ